MFYLSLASELDLKEKAKKDKDTYKYCDWTYNKENNIYIRGCGRQGKAYPEDFCPSCGRYLRIKFDEEKMKNSKETDIFIREELRDFNFNKIKALIDKNLDKKQFFIIRLESSNLLDILELNILRAKLREDGYDFCPIAKSGKWDWNTNGCYIYKKEEV